MPPKKYLKSLITTWLWMLILKRGITTDMSRTSGDCHALSTTDFLRPVQFREILEMHLRKSIKVRARSIYFVTLPLENWAHER